MGRPWDADLEVITVAHRATPRPVTFVYPYYENPQFLRRQLAWWSTYPSELRDSLRAIIVDDGSPTAPAAEVVRSMAAPFPVRLFRIEPDVRWNWLAARNIGLHHAETDWVLVTDMDHVVPEATARTVVYGSFARGVIHGFSRIEHTGTRLAAHPNSWFLTRALFWAVGGYDETLSGLYGTDGEWRRRCAATAPVKILADRLVRHEYEGDSSTTRYLRKQPEDAAVQRLIARRGRDWRPKTLSFPYHEVAA